MKSVKKVTVDPAVFTEDMIKSFKKNGIEYSVTQTKEKTASYREGKRHLHFVPKKGEVMDTCATISDKYICCNVKVIKSVSNCPYDCSYCFLQNYLNDGNAKVVSDIDSMMQEVIEKCSAEPERLFRIGTWELGDSLAYENETKQASQLIQRFASLPNAILELKTKSDIVSPILNCDHKQKTVVSWSLNSHYIVEQHEHKTARLQERLNALKAVTDAGYLVGLHFDPLIFHDDWKNSYRLLLEQTIAATNPNQIAWISVGSLRFNPEMKKKIEENFPATDITYAEMVRGDDGKMRYPKPIRLELYRFFIETLQNLLSCSDLSPLAEVSAKKPLFYFCMERWDVWENLLGQSPSSINHLDYLFARNLQKRFYFNSLPIPKRDVYA